MEEDSATVVINNTENNVSHKTKKKWSITQVPSICVWCVMSSVIFFVVVPISLFITRNNFNLTMIKPI